MHALECIRGGRFNTVLGGIEKREKEETKKQPAEVGCKLACSSWSNHSSELAERPDCLLALVGLEVLHLQAVERHSLSVRESAVTVESLILKKTR